jgi:uncharacterized protein (TIGR02453 family)
VQGPIFCLHLEPGTVFAAAGMWHPEAESLARVRDAIAARPERWPRATRSVALDEGYLLKRPPRGHDPEHPCAEDLRRRSFTSSASFTQAQACAPDFLPRFAEVCRKKAPLFEFRAGAVGLPF